MREGNGPLVDRYIRGVYPPGTASLTASRVGAGVPPPRELLLIAVALGSSVAAGALLSAAPVVGLLLLVPLGCFLIFASAHFRLAFVVFGGILVFWSSNGLSPLKLAYLAGFSIATGVALIQSAANLRIRGLGLSVLLPPSWPFFTLGVVSAAVSILHNTDPTLWLRDASPYLVLLVVPIFVLDAQAHISKRVLAALFVAAGVLAAISTTLEVLSRREVGLSVGQLFLPSTMLALALFCFALSAAFHERRIWKRSAWAVLAAAIMAQFFITGTRASIFLLVAPVAVAVAVSGNLIRRAGRLLLFAAATGLCVLLFTQAFGTVAGVDVNAVISRFESISQLLGDPSADQSYVERTTEAQTAWSTFVSNPVLGAGPGHLFVWRRASGLLEVSFQMDTSLTIPAKFGLVGLGLLVAGFFGYAIFIRKVTSGENATVSRSALFGYVVGAAAWLIVSTPLDDRGFALGLLFLVALGTPQALSSIQPTIPVIGQQNGEPRPINRAKA